MDRPARRGDALTRVTGWVYTDSDAARRVPEPVKRAGAQESQRGPFERDRARVLHSYAFRRLAAKTQVVGPGEDDFPRTRLTHSLEVAQIGREIGQALGCDPDIVDAAGLAHDLGHPPFGHNGEDALDAVSGQIGGFEGNAQTLRILTRLEAKVLGQDGTPAGLNLTRAVVDACCKYPWGRREGTRKFGYYAEDRAAFEWARAGAPEQRRCLEAQVMDWADDVAYSVHDVEDGVYSGHIRLGQVDDAERDALVALAARWYWPGPPDRLEPVLESLLRLPPVRDLAAFDRSFAALAAVKRATSELTGRFARAAVEATAAPRPLARYAADLVVPEPVAAECALLKAVAARYVMQRSGADELRARQRRVLTELVEAVADRAPDCLDPALAPSWSAADTEAGKLRVVIDQVAQLTDASALVWHERLVGAQPRSEYTTTAFDVKPNEAFG